MNHRYLLLFVASLVGSFAGCSTSPQIDYAAAGLVDVSGTVTMDEKPLADALVVFETEEGRMSYGRTDADGHYVLRFNRQASGVLPGKKTVRISTGMTTADEAEAGTETPKVETIPSRYNTNSELTADVKPGESQTFNFDLTSEGEIEQPELESDVTGGEEL